MPADLSIVIPAFNEEKHIANCINSLKQYIPDKFSYEVIVIDNGSTDKTTSILEEMEVQYLIIPSVNVSELRNIGIKETQGKYIVFLDADVCITPEWNENIEKTIDYLSQHPNTITGSKCGLSDSNSLLENYWFGPLLSKSSSYVNSGHLITTRELMIRLDGFSTALTTGEDFDLSVRAKKIGAEIRNNPNLKVIHYGYPSNIKHFMLREIWHGIGDAHTINTYVKSKVAIVSSVFLLLHLSLIIILSLGSDISSKLLVPALVLTIATIPLSASIARYASFGIKYIIFNSFIFYLYFTSRAISLFIPAKTKLSRSSK